METLTSYQARCVLILSLAAGEPCPGARGLERRQTVAERPKDVEDMGGRGRNRNQT